VTLECLCSFGDWHRDSSIGAGSLGACLRAPSVAPPGAVKPLWILGFFVGLGSEAHTFHPSTGSCEIPWVLTDMNTRCKARPELAARSMSALDGDPKGREGGREGEGGGSTLPPPSTPAGL
jgi:hypothetical protein